MGRLAGLITGRRAKWAVAAAAVLAAGALAAQAGRAQTTSDPAVLLPGGTESVEALRAIERFPSGDVTPAAVVAWRDGGLTGRDRAAIRATLAAIERERLPGAGPPSEPRVSADGATAVAIVPFRVVPEERLVAAVEDLRALTAGLERGGLEVAVTGGAGFAADVSGVFGGIDGVLLIGAATLVLVLLVAIYRSPVFWLIPFVCVLLAEGAQRGAQFLLGEAGFAITGQAAGIASVLTFGAATDYALLLVARYREELLEREDTHDAMRRALASAAPAIVASALTVVLALLTLLLARVGSTEALGPLAAAGVLVSMALSLTLLPAALLIAGRRAFWPRIPRAGAAQRDPAGGAWGRLGAAVRRRPRRVWIGGAGVLAALSLGLTQLDLGLAQNQQFATEVEAVEGQERVARAGLSQSAPALQVVVPDPGEAGAVARAVERVSGVTGTGEPERGRPGALLGVTLRDDPFGSAALARVPAVRDAARQAGGGGVLVGGPVAEDYDSREAAERDTRVIVPVTLVVVLAILGLLLRALVLPLLLIVTVILSFTAALGVGVLASELLLGFAGVDTTLPLIAFIFLVALGVDYNIFLVARAREETARHGTGDGMLRALTATGAVITSAGVVLAGTFSILALIPFVALVQLGVIIAFGVLLDTLLVRSIVVPALVWDTGRAAWWPSRAAP